MKDVFAIYESKDGRERSRWVRVGVAFDNKDGSLNLLLDAIPLCGRLHVRERITESATRAAPTETAATEAPTVVTP